MNKIKTILKSTVVTICIFILILFCGCALFQDVITPCYIHPSAREMVGLDKPLLMPYTTLFDARYVKAMLNTQLVFLEVGMAASEEWRNTVFSPNGLGLILPSSLMSILAAMGGGKWIKRPQEKEKDKKIVELEKKVNGNIANNS